MFWNRKREPTVTAEDREWVDESLPWLLSLFGRERLLALPTLTPNTRHFPYQFTKTEADAEFVLTQVCTTMDTDRANIDLAFHDDGARDLSEGIRMSPADDKGLSKGAAGTYQETEAGRSRITVNVQQLENLHRLIATIAHEVAHIKLLGERRIDADRPDHEPLTDLTAIIHGYGIFLGNTAFMFNQWQGSSHQGWQMSRTGYLPEEVIAYALARFTVEKAEEREWERYLTPTMKKYFQRNRAYLSKD